MRPRRSLSIGMIQEAVIDSRRATLHDRRGWLRIYSKMWRGEAVQTLSPANKARFLWVVVRSVASPWSKSSTYDMHIINTYRDMLNARE